MELEDPHERLGALSMRELAERWSAALIADFPPEDRLSSPAQASGSLLRPPASSEAIEAAESRLGCVLPADYRAFLAISDGAYGDDYGATRWMGGPRTELPGLGTSVVGVGFLPVADVRWLRETQPEHAELLALCGEDLPITEEQTSDPVGWAAMARGLVVATEKGPGTSMLIPFEGLVDWQFWNVHKETVRAHLSFRALLEWETFTREAIEDLEEAKLVIAGAVAGDPMSSLRLERIATPAAVPALEALLEHTDLAIGAIRALGRVGNPEALAILKASPHPGSVQGLVLMGTAPARDVLVERDAWINLVQLGDPRGADLAALRLEVSPSDSKACLALALATRQGDHRYLAVLRSLLDGESDLAFTAAHALATVGDDAGLRALEGFARSRSFRNRAAAAHWLARCREDFPPSSPPDGRSDDSRPS